MNAKILIPWAALLAIAPPAANAADKLGDHPAVVVQRLWATKTYDYESKFYPHPAWLYLRMEASPTDPDITAKPSGPEQPSSPDAEHRVVRRH